MKNFKLVIGVLLIMFLLASCVTLEGGAVFGSERLKYSNVDFKSDVSTKASNSTSSSETGFYLGVQFTDIPIAEGLEFRPTVHYVAIKDLDQIQVPLLVRYSFTDEFHALAGPNLGFLMDTGEGVKSFNFGADLGLAYDISDDFSIGAKYNMGFSNLFENGGGDYSLKLSHFMVGVAYRFHKK
tara:strand:+ start:47834 stop:48382 length:549 start_codon:yes stop_codon:yes gene_type:complete